MKVRKLRKKIQNMHGFWTIQQRFKTKSLVRENGKERFRYLTKYSSGSEVAWR